MTTQEKRQQRAMELMGLVGRMGYTPEKALAEFSSEEIIEAKGAAAGGGYGAAHFGLASLLVCKQLQSGIEWLDCANSRPAYNTNVLVSYLYDGQPTIEEAYLTAEGWLIRGTRKIPVTPYAWRPKMELRPAPVRV